VAAAAVSIDEKYSSGFEYRFDVVEPRTDMTTALA